MANFDFLDQSMEFDTPIDSFFEAYNTKPYADETEPLDKVWNDYTEFKAMLDEIGFFNEIDTIDDVALPTPSFSSNEVALPTPSLSFDDVPRPSLSFRFDEAPRPSLSFRFDEAPRPSLSFRIDKSTDGEELVVSKPRKQNLKEYLYIKRCMYPKTYKIGRTTVPSKLKRGTQLFECKFAKTAKSKIASLLKMRFKQAKNYGADFFEGDYAAMVATIISVLNQE